MVPQLRTTAIVVILALFAGMGQAAVMSGRVLVPLEEEEKLGAESKSSREQVSTREQTRRRGERHRYRSAVRGISRLPSLTSAGVRTWSIRSDHSPGRATELLYRNGCGAVLLI